MKQDINILQFVKKNPKGCGGGKKYTRREIERRMKPNVLQMFHFNLV
jgi:hypothetical protein